MNKYGICCIVLSLENNDPPQKFQRMTYKKFSETPREEAIAVLSKRILNNINVTFSAIKYCFENNNCYRMSSDLFPLMTYDKADITLDQLPDCDKIKQLFLNIKEFIKQNNVRCSMHPDQFVVPASEKNNVVEKSIKELEHHANLMDCLGLPLSYDSPINIHMNCFNGGNLEEVEKRFISIFEQLPDNIKSRLVLEIEDKKNSWSLDNLYSIYKKTNIPITYDSHHFRLNNPTNTPPEEAISKCIETWGNYRPLFHFSNGKKNSKDRAHSDYVYELHYELFESNVDIDFEFKAKDLAVKDFESKKGLFLESLKL